MSKKIIISIAGCSKCTMLKNQCPDVESVELKPEEILAFARAAGITSMPFAVIVEPSPTDLQ